ncbi:MAG: gliding motility-associated-like protein, partial [Marinoscillum sp.]
TVTFQIDDVACFGGNDGSVSSQVSGGYGSYKFVWLKDGVSFPETGSFANNLEAAFYRVTITDLQGCVISRTVEVKEPDPFLISLTRTDNTCSTPYDAVINANVTGGVQPYAFQWLRNGLPYSKVEDLTEVPAGTYQLLAVDTNFCETNSIEVVVTAPEKLGINVLNLDDNLCPNTANGALSIQGIGGVFPYTYSMDQGAFGPVNNFVNLDDQKYIMTVQDDVGCTYDTTITIRNQYNLEAEFSLTTEEFAIDFPITLNDESLGEGIVSWLWDFGDTRASEDQNTSVTYRTPGTYVLELTVENEVGCTLSKVDTLEIEQGFVFTVPTAFTPNGDGSNDSFRPGFQNVQSMDIRIQDRNGLVVFESDKISASWDGKFNGNDAPQGPYFYEITYTPKSGISRKHSGKIVILR